MQQPGKRVFITGNEAMGEAAVTAGCRFYAGYPITPQNELTAYMACRMPEVGGVFIQAESELAAVNMVFGAASTGTRAMTSSSSPGISLKQEGISYLAGCQLPCVIINVMRAGPGLGSITPGQGDYFQATKGGGHGDYNMIVLAPSSVEEAFNFTFTAFDLADKYRNPVLILTDAFIGQMAESIAFNPERTGKPASDNDWALVGAKNRESRSIRSLFLKEGDLEKHNMVLQAKFKLMREKEVRFQSIDMDEAEIVLVAYGSAWRIARETKIILEEKGLRVGMFRPLTLWPFPYQELGRLTADKKAVFVFELSSGQMVEDVALSLQGQVPFYFYGRMGGGVFDEEELAGFVETKFKK